jgi:putative lipoprotein
VKVRGSVELPANAPRGRARRLLVEVRDQSVADAPSRLVAKKEIKNVRLDPGKLIPFELEIPDVDGALELAFRVHVDRNGSGVVEPGDLLTTRHCPVPADPVETPASVPVQVV